MNTDNKYKEPWNREYISEFFKRLLAEHRQQETESYEDEKERQYRLYREAYPIEKFNRWIIGDIRGQKEQKELEENPGYFAEFSRAFPLGLN